MATAVNKKYGVILKYHVVYHRKETYSLKEIQVRKTECQAQSSDSRGI